jgi:hypothetical protein
VKETKEAMVHYCATEIVQSNHPPLGFFSSATMTSGDEDDYLACSYKTVIHRPAAPHFYLAPTDLPAQSLAIAPPSSPVIAAAAAAPPPVPVLVLPPPPVNLPIHHRAHTETDLLFYNQQAVLYPVPWYPAPAFIFPNQTVPAGSFVYASPAPFVMHPVPQQPQLGRSSSADCRRTATNGNEHRVVHPERAW